MAAAEGLLGSVTKLPKDLIQLPCVQIKMQASGFPRRKHLL